MGSLEHSALSHINSTEVFQSCSASSQYWCVSGEIQKQQQNQGREWFSPNAVFISVVQVQVICSVL